MSDKKNKLFPVDFKPVIHILPPEPPKNSRDYTKFFTIFFSLIIILIIVSFLSHTTFLPDLGKLTGKVITGMATSVCSCSSEGYECGTLNCFGSVTFNCGSCHSGKTCVAGKCQNRSLGEICLSLSGNDDLCRRTLGCEVCNCDGLPELKCSIDCGGNCKWVSNPTYGGGSSGYCSPKKLCISTSCGNGDCDIGENHGNCPGDCPIDCIANCTNRECGDDGCGNLIGCGTCTNDKFCNPYGKCTSRNQSICNNNTICEPDLGETKQNCPKDCNKTICIPYTGRECGTDGCGGLLGNCSVIYPGANYTCNTEGKCVPRRVTCPNGLCDFGENITNCPKDCKGSCGNLVCEPGEGENILTCPADCWNCTRDCTKKVCGSDKCGDSCGLCPPIQFCMYGNCVNKTNMTYPELLLYHKFDDYIFLGKDYSGNNKNGMNFGVAYTRLGRLAGSGVFNGKLSKILVSWQFPEEGTTMAAWIKPKASETLNGQRIVSLEGGVNAGIGIDKQGYFEFSQNSKTLASSSIKANANKWYHLVGVIYEDKSVALFVNGYRVATGGKVGEDQWKYIITGVSDRLGNYKPTSGQIDEVKVYKKAMTDAEVLALYKSYPPIKCLSQWKCTQFSKCAGLTGNKTRTCIDLSECDSPSRKPLITVPCNWTCKEAWECDWSECTDGYITPENCEDLNYCGTETSVPTQTECEVPQLAPETQSNWQIYVIIIGIILALTAIFITEKRKKQEKIEKVIALAEEMPVIQEPREIYTEILRLYNKLDNKSKKEVYPKILEAYKLVFENV